MGGVGKSDRMANSCQLPYVEVDKEIVPSSTSQF